MPTNFVLFAPGVHAGGGLVLLQGLINKWNYEKKLSVYLDVRAKSIINLGGDVNVVWVMNTIRGRLSAEWQLSKAANNDVYTRVLCFNGLPPLFCRYSPKLVVFLQNRLHFEKVAYSNYSLRTRLRIFSERLLFSLLKKNVPVFIVQTPSMERLVKSVLDSTYDNDAKVYVLPFSENIQSNVESSGDKQWDFIYVSDGVAHKNHNNLIQAWVELAAVGVFPRLAITLGRRDRKLFSELETTIKRHNLNIVNLGCLEHKDVLDHYNHASALIFPSQTESFGLPLIEARQLQLPILAPELDYVRDVCTPVETFDPHSPVSIARAVQRFMGDDPMLLGIKSPEEFLQSLTTL